MAMVLKVIDKEKYVKNIDNIPSDYIIIIDDNILIKVFYDKRSKLAKNKKSDTAYIFKSKPSTRGYFYNTIEKKKTNIRKSDKYIFVGDFLNIEIECSIEKNGYFLVSKYKTRMISKY